MDSRGEDARLWASLPVLRVRIAIPLKPKDGLDGAPDGGGLSRAILRVCRPKAGAGPFEAPRHAALVRITHWLTVIAFLAL